MNNAACPKVSIVIPVYNGADYLKEAIESALNQTYQNIEIIIVDDGSNDGQKTKTIATSFRERVRYIYKENGGVASALNRGIQEMTGDYFSWLSHDDVYKPDKIASQIQYIEKLRLGNKTILYGDFDVIDKDGKYVKTVHLRAVDPERFRYQITVANQVHGCTMLIPAGCFKEKKYFNESLRTTQDYDAWFRLAKEFCFIHMPKILISSRQHDMQGSRVMSGTARLECDSLLKKFADMLSEEDIIKGSRGSLSYGYEVLAANFRRRGFRGAALFASRRSRKSFLRQSPFWMAATLKLMLYNSLVEPQVKRLGVRFPRYSKKIHKTINALRKSWGYMNARKRFTRFYGGNVFVRSESRSGEGSSLFQTRIIREEIPKLLKELKADSFIDAPCGDLFWIKEMELPVRRYLGVDVVSEIIVKNRRQYADKKRTFKVFDITENVLPKADVIFCRDCLVHLTYKEGLAALRNFKKSGSKYLLTTTFPGREKNSDGNGAYFWRPLNLELPPFNFPKPIRIINEGCLEGGGSFADKSLGLWRLDDLIFDHHAAS